MEQVGDAVVHGRRRDEQHARTDAQSGEGPVAVGVGVPEAMRFVDDEQPDGRTVGPSDRADTQGLMREYGRCDAPLSQQGAPLGHEHGRHDERERLPQRQAGDSAGGMGSPRTTRALKRWKPPRAGSATRPASAVSQREFKSAASAWASSAVRVAMPYTVLRGTTSGGGTAAAIRRATSAQTTRWDAWASPVRNSCHGAPAR